MWILATDTVAGRFMEAALSLGRRLAPLIVVIGVAVSTPGTAQNLDAGKTPAQLFASNCQDCHRSPGGLAKNTSSWSLSGFLRVHYTTSSAEAAALAAYVLAHAREPAPRKSRRATSRPKEKSAAEPADANIRRPPADIDSTPAEASKPAGDAPATAAKPASAERAPKPAPSSGAAKPAGADTEKAAASAGAGVAIKPAAPEKPAAASPAPAGKKPAEGAGAQ